MTNAQLTAHLAPDHRHHVGPFQLTTFTGGFWLRVFGVGFSIKRLDLYPPLFSQRGKCVCAFGLKFNVLGRAQALVAVLERVRGEVGT